MCALPNEQFVDALCARHANGELTSGATTNVEQNEKDTVGTMQNLHAPQGANAAISTRLGS